MAQAGQQINVGGPRTDPVHGGQRGVRVVGPDRGKACKRQLAVFDRARDRLYGADFGCGQPKPGEPGRSRLEDRIGLERIERGFEPAPDRVGAGGRKLLRDDNRDQRGEAVLAPAQRRPAGFGQQAAQTAGPLFRAPQARRRGRPRSECRNAPWRRYFTVHLRNVASACLSEQNHRVNPASRQV